VPSSSTLRRNLPLWGFGITLAVLIGGALTGYLSAQRLIANERLAAHSDDAIVDLTRLLSTLRDTERSQRGYLLTGNDAYPQSYRDDTERIERELASLSREVAPGAGQRKRVATLRKEIDLKLAELGRTVSLQQAGDRAAALAIVRASASEALMDQVSAQVAAIQSAEYAILDRRAEESERSSRTTIAAIVAPTLIAAGLLGLVYFLINRRMIELREADRQKDEFLALLAHELRGPLAPVRTGLELIKRSSGAEELLRRTCASMERQVEHLIRLINDLLDASRIARGKIELRRAPTELGELIREVLEVKRPQAEAADLELVAILPATPLFVDGDPVRLTQVFRNLLENARKYTQPGGRIEISLAPQRGQAVVRVKDTGLGIPPDKLDAIFEMFVQINRNRSHSQGGLGIGLALAKRLLVLHGGSIEALSEGPGRGSEFVVRLPLTTVARGRAPTNPAEETVTPPRRILIVDDNTDTAASLALLLKLAHHETYTAHDGLEALNVAERLQPDVVLLDLQLPKLDGYEVCRRIRQRPWARSITLVAVTGLGQEEDQRRSKEAGFDAHLVKPPDYAELTRLLLAHPH
jgi:signal transduction histidine kinase